MKAQSKAIVASLVVLALAVCAVSGATYSWFSDTEEAEINITAGKINLDITEGSVLYYNHVGVEIPPVDIESNGVVITRGNDSQFTVTVSGMAPGDVLKLQFSGTLTNTIKAVLLFNTDVFSPAGLSSPFTIVNEYNVNGDPYGNYVSASAADKELVSTVTITMANVGNEYNGAEFAIGLNFSAYQANTPGSDLPQDSMINTVSGTIYANEDTTIYVSTPTDSKIGGVSLMIPFGSVETDTTIQVSAVSGATNEDTSFVAAMEEYGSIIGGVNVSGVESLSKDSTIEFTIAGDYSGTKLAIYHEGKELEYVNSAPPQNGEFTTIYDSEDKITTVTICASEFSTYYAVSVDAVASINGVKYYSLKEAFDAVQNGGEIKLLRNEFVSKTLSVQINKSFTFNTNGYTLSGAFSESGQSALITNNGTLTITGGGRIVYLAEHPDTDWYPEGFPTYATNTISNKGSLTIGDDKTGVTIVNETSGGASYAIDNYAPSKLTINNGTVLAENVAIRIFTSSSNDKTDNSIKVDINGGTIDGKRAIWIQLAGGTESVAPVVSLTINGGEFYCNSPQYEPVIYSYSYGNSNDNVSVVINGGAFHDSGIAFDGGVKNGTAKVTINGGTFDNDVIRYTNGGYEVIKSAGTYIKPEA